MAVTKETTNLKKYTSASLLASTSRVEAPFVYVKIGGYEFGVYEQPTGGVGSNKFYKNVAEKYPNYVQSLDITKINGTVNQYTLNISYPVTNDVDPNFFDKIFSSVSSNRKVIFSYGDFSLPNYIYRNEEAIITGVTEQFDIKKSVINYTVSAVSSAHLTLSGSYFFKYRANTKPSDVIKEILYNNEYHLLDVFTGMKDKAIVLTNNFISSNDKPVNIEACSNISVLEYISKLVNMMIPVGTADSSVKSSSIYTLTTYEDTSSELGGPYFKVEKIETSIKSLNSLCTYSIDIGYPTANIVTDFTINQNDNWSILFDYSMNSGNTDYIKTINAQGKEEYKYSPLLTGVQYTLRDYDKTWWTKVTEFPIQAEIRLKGLLRPAILMTYVKLNVWFYGRKHISSGYYIITSQKDKIDANGYFTTLGITRVAGDEGFIDIPS